MLFTLTAAEDNDKDPLDVFDDDDDDRVDLDEPDVDCCLLLLLLVIYGFNGGTIFDANDLGLIAIGNRLIVDNNSFDLFDDVSDDDFVDIFDDTDDEMEPELIPVNELRLLADNNLGDGGDDDDDDDEIVF